MITVGILISITVLSIILVPKKTLEIIKNTENQQDRGGQIIDDEQNIQITLVIHDKSFYATLQNNETVQQFVSKFPITLTMNDLHQNEKYDYLDITLKTNPEIPDIIHAGDIKLYGDNCLVLFYKNFQNIYPYTNIGKIEDIDAFIKEITKEDVTVTFLCK